MRARLDKALLVRFDTHAELVTDLVDDPVKLEAGIRDLRPGGGTALYDAIYYACRDKLALDQPRTKFRRAIVIVSDGDDNQSDYTRDQALEMAQKADVVIYAISTNISRAETDGDKVLRYLTAETGGRAFFPFKVEDMAQSFENIANELRHQYNILYRPEPLVTDGLWHPVQLRVKGRKDLMVPRPRRLLRAQDVSAVIGDGVSSRAILSHYAKSGRELAGPKPAAIQRDPNRAMARGDYLRYALLVALYEGQVAGFLAYSKDARTSGDPQPGRRARFSPAGDGAGAGELVSGELSAGRFPGGPGSNATARSSISPWDFMSLR